MAITLKGNRNLLQVDSSGALHKNFEVYERHLTEKGRMYFNDLMFYWLAYTDRTNKIDNVKILEKWYLKITGRE